MNTNHKLRVQHLVFSLLIITFAKLSYAHDQSGSLGEVASAIDQYQVHCFDDGFGPNGYLDISVQDTNPKASPKLSLQVAVGNVAFNTTDAVDADAAYSPELSVKGNADEFYYVTVDKTSAGVENYQIQYHCMTNDNQHTGTEIVQLTDQ